MAKFSIAWMPGDGIGNDVMEATRIVLDAMKLDAEYIHTDIGWDFWCREGNPLPDRSIEILKKTTCGLFGAITSKPQDDYEGAVVWTSKGWVMGSPYQARVEAVDRTNGSLAFVGQWGGDPVYKLGQKETPSPPDFSRTTITSIYLSSNEYEVLAALPADELRKRRHVLRHNDRDYTVDIFQGRHSGLILAETSFETDAEMKAQTAPPFASREVSHELRFTGRELAKQGSVNH